jgi:hypothetical protein
MARFWLTVQLEADTMAEAIARTQHLPESFDPSNLPSWLIDYRLESVDLIPAVAVELMQRG